MLGGNEGKKAGKYEMANFVRIISSTAFYRLKLYDRYHT